MEKYRTRIEEHASSCEKIGFSPVGARVYVYLLFAPGHQCTFEEVASYFKVSKSAISNGLKYLETIKLVYSKTMNGQRKRFFKLDIEANTGVEYAMRKLEMMQNMLEDIFKTRDPDIDKDELEDLIGFYKTMTMEYPRILEKWKRSGKSDKKGK